MNTSNEMTIGEMMLHFHIAQKHYNSFAKWVSNYAHKRDLISPNNTRKNKKLYQVDKVEKFYPDKHFFNTRKNDDEVQAAAELLSATMSERTGQKLTADEILTKLDSYDNRRVFLSTVQNYIVEMIKWHDETREHRNSCWGAVRRVNWLTVAYLIVLIVNIVICICL